MLVAIQVVIGIKPLFLTMKVHLDIMFHAHLMEE